jgi:hypothetical protein
MLSPRVLVARFLDKVAHRPTLGDVTLARYRQGEAAMMYFIDATRNHSKFYEMAVVPDDVHPGMFTLKKRWGALTDSGTGRVDARDEGGLTYEGAVRGLAVHAKAKLAKGYQDAFKSRPVGQYPVGLQRDVGFGWGSQSATVCVPQLRQLQQDIDAALVAGDLGDLDVLQIRLEEAQRIVNSLERSSMATELAKHLRGPLSSVSSTDADRFFSEKTKVTRELKTLSNYIRRQVAECNV